MNGVSPSWADIQVRVSPLGGTLIEVGDISALSGGPTVEVGRQREGGRTIKRTQGTVSYEASMTLYSSGWHKLIRGLVAQAPLRGNQRLLSLAVFNIGVLWTPVGSDDIFERRYKGCRILGATQDSAEGNDAQQIEVPIDVLEIADFVDGVEIVLL